MEGTPEEQRLDPADQGHLPQERASGRAAQVENVEPRHARDGPAGVHTIVGRKDIFV